MTAELEIIEQGDVELAIVNEINNQHELFIGSLKRARAHAIRCGQLLIEQKKKLSHGEWLPWIMANLSFKKSMAENYMHLARNSQRVGNLPEDTPVRQLLSSLKPLETEEKLLPTRVTEDGTRTPPPELRYLEDAEEELDDVVDGEYAFNPTKLQYEEEDRSFSWMQDEKVKDLFDGIKAISQGVEAITRAGTKDRGAAEQILNTTYTCLKDIILTIDKYYGRI